MMHFKLPVPNRILVNHVIQSAQVKSEIECETNCFAHDDCMSVNLAPLQDGNYLCELSNSDHDIHPEDFKQMNRALFKPVKVSLVWSLPKLNVCVKAGFFILIQGTADCLKRSSRLLCCRSYLPRKLELNV